MNEVIESIETHIENAYEGIAAVGGNIPENKNLENISASLNDLYNILPKTTATGEDILLTTARQGKMEINLKGNTSQVVIPEEQGTIVSNTSINVNDVNTSKEHSIEMSGNTYQYTTTGKNLFDISTITSISNGSINNGVISIDTTKTNTTILFNSLSLLPGKYYISADIKKVEGVKTFVNMNDGVNTYNNEVNPTLSTTYQRYQTSYTYSNNKSLGQIFVNFSNSQGEINIKNIMISTSSDITYEEYSGGQPSPNPTYPQNIEVVTGDNNITICGKNLLPISDITDITGLINNGTSITLNGIPTSTSWNLTNPITLKANTTYTLSLSNYIDNQSSTDRFILRNGNTNIIIIYFKGDNVSYTPTQDTTIDVLRLYTTGEYSFSNYTFSIQLEEGSTATTFEAYTGTTYPINLGKNLANLSIIGQVPSISTGNLVNLSNGATTEFIDIDNTSDYKLSYTGGSSAYTYVFFYDDNKNYLGNQGSIASGYSLNTYSSWNNAKYVRIRCDSYSSFTTLQLEKGSTATEYSPYFTPIELVKIGDYKDRIYKQNDKWYLEKNIGKVVLNGGTSESYNSLGGSGSYPYYIFYNNNTLVSNSIVGSTLYANYFITDKTAGLLQKDGGCRIAEYNSINRIFFCIHSITSVNDFKTWLSIHNTTVYYVLNTPTTTEITDTSLVNQLNALYNSTLYSTTNINTTTSNLLPYIDLQYNVVTPSPSPNRSSNIEISTGENNITICGKNLFNFSLKSGTSAGITTTIEGTNLTITGKATSNSRNITNDITNNFQPGTYTFSLDQATPIRLILRFFSNGTTKSSNSINVGNTSVTFTLDGTETAYRLIANPVENTTYNVNLKLQLEKGSTATTYEQYQGNTYEINLGKNLLPNNVSSQTTHDIVFTKNEDGSVYAKGTASALTQINVYGTNANPIPNTFPNGTYTLSGGIKANQTLTIKVFKTGGNNYYASSGTGISFTIDDNTTGIWVYLNIANGQVIDGTFYPMLEKGSVASSYSAYKTPIELCKIGTYQDYFYKDNGNWYKHSEIGKVIYDGSNDENWKLNGQNENYGQYYIATSDKEYGLLSLISNNFIISSSATTNCIRGSASTTNIYLTIAKSIVPYDINNLKSWLSSNNTIVYYNCTPTDTQITDTTLIQQLNNLLNTYSYNNQTNILQDNTDKPFILNISALKKKTS